MSSFIQDGESSCAPSTTAESTAASRTSTHNKGKKSSNIWHHTRDPLEYEDQELSYCSYCEIDKKPHGAKNASSMTKHIQAKHKTVVIEPPLSKNQQVVRQQLIQIYHQAAANGDTIELDKEILTKSINQDALTEALVTLIVLHNLSFCVVEWPAFHTFCQILNSTCEGMITTSHSVVRTRVGEAFQKHKDTVRKALQGALSHIHISLDIWTSPNQWLILAICAHFTSYDQKNEKALLALKKVPGHSGDDQFSILLPVLRDYAIELKLGAIIADNAAPNNVLCRTIEKYMWEEHERDWKANDWRIRCIGHIINLVVQAFLFSDLVDMDELESYDEEEADGELTDKEVKKAKFRLLGPLGKAHNIVVHIRGSGSRAEYWRALAGRMIPMDNRTRWNSWHNLLEVLLKEKAHIDEYCERFEHELYKDLLDLADWKKLRTINVFLQPFASGTLFTEGDSIDRTLFTMDVLIKHIQITIVRAPYLLSFYLINSYIRIAIRGRETKKVRTF
jgi:hypothetical protein